MSLNTGHASFLSFLYALLCFKCFGSKFRFYTVYVTELGGTLGIVAVDNSLNGSSLKDVLPIECSLTSSCYVLHRMPAVVLMHSNNHLHLPFCFSSNQHTEYCLIASIIQSWVSLAGAAALWGTLRLSWKIFCLSSCRTFPLSRGLPRGGTHHYVLQAAALPHFGVIPSG